MLWTTSATQCNDAVLAMSARHQVSDCSWRRLCQNLTVSRALKMMKAALLSRSFIRQIVGVRVRALVRV